MLIKWVAQEWLLSHINNSFKMVMEKLSFKEDTKLRKPVKVTVLNSDLVAELSNSAMNSTESGVRLKLLLGFPPS